MSNFSGLLTIAQTTWPLANACCTKRRPIGPDAPKTANLGNSNSTAMTNHRNEPQWKMYTSCKSTPCMLSADESPSSQSRSLRRHRAWTSSDSTGFGKRSFRRSCRKEPKLNKCKLLYYQRELPVKYSELRILNLIIAGLCLLLHHRYDLKPGQKFNAMKTNFVWNSGYPQPVNLM